MKQFSLNVAIDSNFHFFSLSRVRSKEKLVTRRRTIESEAVSKKDRDEANLLLDERLNEEEEMSKMDEQLAEKDYEKVTDDQQKKCEEEEEDDDDDDEQMAVPQVRLGPDGQIIIDDRSLVRLEIQTFSQSCK